MTTLANLDFDQVDTILDRLYDNDSLVLEFTDFSDEMESFILGRGFTTYIVDEVIYVENTSYDLNGAWIN